MARTPYKKEISGARLLKAYASWIYCTGCNKTVAYLCYVTYDSFYIHFDCKCGNSGSIHIEFGEMERVEETDERLIQIKNRLCCPNDQSPLLTLVDKNLNTCSYEIVCKSCSKTYKGTM